MISIKIELSQRQYKMNITNQQCIKENVFTDEAPYIINLSVGRIFDNHLKRLQNEKDDIYFIDIRTKPN